MQFTVLPALCNKFPCEGPRVIPIACDFSASQTYDANLTSLVTQGKVSEIQAVFVDNSQNDAELVITVSIQQQVIRIPAYSQGYVMLLASAAEFTIYSSSILTATVFALNFPVTNAIWNKDGSTVSVSNFPASQIVQFNPSVSSAFKPSSTGAVLATSSASANVAITVAAGENLRLFNDSAQTCHIRLGTSVGTATLNDTAIPAGGVLLINANSNTNLAAILPSGTGSLQYTTGSGGI